MKLFDLFSNEKDGDNADINLLHSGVEALSFCINRQLFLSENTFLYPFTLEKSARLKFELILKTFIRLVLIFDIGYSLIIFELIIAIVSLFKINLFPPLQ